MLPSVPCVARLLEAEARSLRHAVDLGGRCPVGASSKLQPTVRGVLQHAAVDLLPKHLRPIDVDGEALAGRVQAADDVQPVFPKVTIAAESTLSGDQQAPQLREVAQRPCSLGLAVVCGDERPADL